MAMTQQVKAELATLAVAKPELRRAEAATMLRFCNSLHIAAGSSSRRNSTPVPRPGGCGPPSPTCSASARSSS
jgi:hypothetical protein